MKNLLFIIIATCLFAGCTTTVPQRRKQAVRYEARLSALEESVERLENRMQGLHQSQQDAYDQIDRLESEQDDKAAKIEKELAEVVGTVADLDTRQARMKKEVVDQLIPKIASLLQETGSGASRQNLRGREHEVRAGQTLSEIAAAYGVSVNAIIDANDLKDPDNIRKGQKLFIPE